MQSHRCRKGEIFFYCNRHRIYIKFYVVFNFACLVPMNLKNIVQKMDLKRLIQMPTFLGQKKIQAKNLFVQ